jgi:hypothetical protein
MASKNQIVKEYARMWPREVFYHLVPNESGKGKKVALARGLELVDEPGVYVLYRDDIPHYIGQAGKLRHRLWQHACVPGARYYNFWNHFSAFVIENPKLRDEVEGILIAAMPTANSAKPRLERAKFPVAVSRMTRDIYRLEANPSLEFEKLALLVRKGQQLQKRKRRNAKAA